jgi:predicted MFS family arabinose efflux permease
MRNQLALQLAVAIFCRFLLKTGRRFIYPFAAAISGALGVSLAAITLLLALNQVAALLGPLFAQLNERWGYRTMMIWGMILASLAMLAIGVLPGYGVLLVGLVAIGVSISICDPALQAYVGMKIPFARRGQAIGLTELAWAASSLVGIPVAGWLVQSYSWSTPFMVMGALGIGGSILLRRLLPHADATPSPKTQPWPAAHRAVLRLPAAKSMLLYAFLAGCACDIFFVSYALWLTESLGMGVMALGLATIAIGFAELSGELLTAALADRLGLRRTVLVTLLLSIACYATLPLWSFSATGSLIGIFLACLAFEFNFVAAISLSTEIRPDGRATMMSMFQATSGMGHVCGVLLGGFIWFAGGIAGVGIACALLCLLAFVVLYKGLSQWHLSPAPSTIKPMQPERWALPWYVRVAK